MRASGKAAPLERPVRPGVYGAFFLLFCVILFAGHAGYLRLPFFWDELGQFVPAALDILRDHAWIPKSAVPNVHPPGVMALLALVWRVAGYSIASTRSTMLVVASCGVMFTFLLAIRLSRGMRGAPAFAAVLLLCLDPLFFTQSMMAQLDMPAMVLTVAGLLLFLEDRHFAAGMICTALVLTKETGLLLPMVCGGWLLLQKGRRGDAAYYAAPFLALAGWLVALKTATGFWFGDPGFTHYNLGYALNPVRAASSLLRRVYYLFVADFRWIGAVGLGAALRRGAFRSPAWRITGIFATLHIVLVSVLGGAELERYLLPVLPLFYIACAAAWTWLRPLWRTVSIAGMAGGLLAGMFVNPPYPFPFENNLAMADFVDLQQAAAGFTEQMYAGETIYTAWPLTAALRRPEFGYVHTGLATFETSDLHASTLSKLDASRVKVLILYSRTWEPEWSLLRAGWARNFLSRFYEYEPQLTAEQARRVLGLVPIMRWSRRGQWVELLAKERPAGVYTVRR